MKKAFLLFSGYNARALIAFIRRLNALQAPYAIIACGEDDFIFHTRYKKQVEYIRKKKELAWDELEEALHYLSRNNPETEFVLCPSSEYLNHFALEHRRQLSEAGVMLPLVSKGIYETVTNKENFSLLCSRNGLNVPKRLNSADSLKIPFVAKPKINILQGRTLYPYLVLNKRIYNQFLEQEEKSNYYFEEYIADAESYYLLFYVSRFGRSVSFSQKNIFQQANGKSIVLAQPADLHRKEVGKRYLELLQRMDFNGLIMIELKKRGNEYIMIEANPRLWGPSQLFVDNEQPIFDAFIYETLFDRIYTVKRQKPKLEKKYVWVGGMLQNISRGDRLARYIPTGKSRAVLLTLSAVKNDVYLRKDTWPYFFKELKTSLILRRT